MQVQQAKAPVLKKAADNLLNVPKFSGLRREMDAFRSENPWVEDSALFFCLITFQVDFLAHYLEALMYKLLSMIVTQADVWADQSTPDPCPKSAYHDSMAC